MNNLKIKHTMFDKDIPVEVMKGFVFPETAIETMEEDHHG